MNPQPEVFGLHENADITKNNYETLMVPKHIFLNIILFIFIIRILVQLLNGTILTQSQITAGGSDKDADAKTVELASNIAKNIPDLFDIIEATKKYPTMYEQSMNTVIKQVQIKLLLFKTIMLNILFIFIPIPDTYITILYFLFRN